MPAGTPPAASTTGIPPALTVETELLNASLPSINAAFSAASGVINSLVTGASSYRSTYEQSLLENFGVYSNLIKGINNTLTSCPPSGAIAGIYSLIDNQRGVWKAPANVSLNSVIGPLVNFDTGQSSNPTTPIPGSRCAA